MKLFMNNLSIFSVANIQLSYVRLQFEKVQLKSLEITLFTWKKPR